MSTTTTARALRLIIMGAPGSGKGTLAARLTRDFPTLVSISTGDVLRHHTRTGTDLGKAAASYVGRGELVPDKLVTDLVQCELHARASTPLLLDGYPRTAAQARDLDAMSGVHAALVLDVPADAILARVLGRWVHPGSGRTYNTGYNPPKVAGHDDVTGEPLVHRADDNKEVLEQRLAVYEQSTRPLIEYYRKAGVLHALSGTTSDEIYPKMHQVVSGLFASSLPASASK
ncbi:adenylate kinase-domain-containing protein [Blastocladiella britannica]|nr:adenylate kinase-domain-containing protein [Blastocladiella britannica]